MSTRKGRPEPESRFYHHDNNYYKAESINLPSMPVKKFTEQVAEVDNQGFKSNFKRGS